MSTAPDHLPLETLLDYWLGDADAAGTDAVDEHLMRCDVCGTVLDQVIALGAGVRRAFRAGQVSAMLGAPFLERLAGQGLRIREYRLANGGSVNCTVAPDDDLLVARLAAPLAGVTRLDAITRVSVAADRAERLEDIPFDPQAAEVLYAPRLSAVRRLPLHRMQLTLLSVESGGTREVAHYTFDHRPWPGQQGP